VPREATRTFHVSITVSDLTVRASGLVPPISGAVESQGGRDIHVEPTEGETGIRIAFALEASSESEASVGGRQVLDAVKADDFFWQVGVVQPFTT
jgi:hypothetical protein